MNKIETNMNMKTITIKNDFICYQQGSIGKEIIVAVDELQQENKQLKDNWNKLKEYCQDNSFMQNTREYGTLTVVDADEFAIYMEELEKSD